MLSTDQVRATGAWIAAHQSATGEIPWWPGGKGDPWDHVHAAMGLTVAGHIDEAAKAYSFLAKTQTSDGGWYAWRTDGKVSDRTQETNHAAYLASGLWHFYLATDDEEFLEEMWETLDHAIEFVIRLQRRSGAIDWALDPNRRPWNAPLLTGNASTHGSLVCALRIADLLGYTRPDWHVARERVATALVDTPEVFSSASVVERVGRYAMDWYYPVLGGALRGAAARERLLDLDCHDAFIAQGIGCRCVDDTPWYTVAETCELILAFDSVGMSSHAQQIMSWIRQYRMDDGGYWTGKTWPEDVFWPLEHNGWTAAAVIIAEDALAGGSATSSFFRDLSGDDLIADDEAVGA